MTRKDECRSVFYQPKQDKTGTHEQGWLRELQGNKGSRQRALFCQKIRLNPRWWWDLWHNHASRHTTKYGLTDRLYFRNSWWEEIVWLLVHYLFWLPVCYDLLSTIQSWQLKVWRVILFVILQWVSSNVAFIELDYIFALCDEETLQRVAVVVQHTCRGLPCVHVHWKKCPCSQYFNISSSGN